MRKFGIAFATLLLIAGCGQGNQETAADTAAEVETHAEGAVDAATEAAHDATATTASVTLSGSIGCGHCTHQIGTSCSAALQTAEGGVYILEGMEAGSEPFDKRFDGIKMKVVGSVQERDGVNYVSVDSFEEI